MLTLQLKNLAFALAGVQYEIHIYAIGAPIEIDLPKHCYLHMVEPNAQEGTTLWRDIYDIDVPMLIAADPTIDVLVFSQPDQYWTHPIAEYVTRVRKTGTIILTDEYCGFELLSPDYKTFYYPRVHEVGTIIPSRYIRMAKTAGVSLRYNLENPKILERIKSERDKLWHFLPLHEFKYMQRVEQMAEFSLFCYYSKFPWAKLPMLVHFGGTERLSTRFPRTKDADVTAAELQQMADIMRTHPSMDQIATTMGHLLFCGELAITDEIAKFIKSSVAHSHIVSLYAHLAAASWLDDTTRARVQGLLQAVANAN